MRGGGEGILRKTQVKAMQILRLRGVELNTTAPDSVGAAADRDVSGRVDSGEINELSLSKCTGTIKCRGNRITGHGAFRPIVAQSVVAVDRGGNRTSGQRQCNRQRCDQADENCSPYIHGYLPLRSSGFPSM